MSESDDKIVEETNEISVEENTSSSKANVESLMIDVENPVIVVYCPFCSFPLEYCEYGAQFNDKCKPWILANYPHILGVSDAMEGLTLNDNDDGKKKNSKIGAPKKKSETQMKIVLQLSERQKRKMLTVVTGLESIPDVKIKDCAKLFGKKFSSGTSIGDIPTGGKEIVIQGDFMFQLPELLIKEFKVPAAAIFIKEGATLRAYG